MSSVPMIGPGNAAGISLLGCNAESKTKESPPHQTRNVHQSHSDEPIHQADQAGLQAEPTPPDGGVNRSSLPTTNSAVPTTNGSSQIDATNRNGNAKLNGTSPVNGSSQTKASSNGVPVVNGNEFQGGDSVKLHRIREVREQQGLSLRSIARRIGIDVKSYRQLEDPSHNLTLTELHAVQVALDVPIADLLVDRHGLSQPVKERAKLVKVMKSAVAIREAKSTPRVERLATMLCEQLTELMPELADVSGWPQFGARRGQSALGKALREPIDTSQLGLSE